MHAARLSAYLVGAGPVKLPMLCDRIDMGEASAVGEPCDQIARKGGFADELESNHGSFPYPARLCLNQKALRGHWQFCGVRIAPSGYGDFGPRISKIACRLKANGRRGTIKVTASPYGSHHKSLHSARLIAEAVECWAVQNINVPVRESGSNPLPADIHDQWLFHSQSLSPKILRPSPPA